MVDWLLGRGLCRGIRFRWLDVIDGGLLKNYRASTVQVGNMKNIMMPVIYIVGALVAIIGLLKVMSSGISSGVAIGIGVTIVVVLPVVLSIVLAKPDSEKEQGK